ncbi:partial Putative HTH-type transcriptional regulator, partial [Anaerolineae bacterium]
MAIHNYSRQLTPFIGRETEIETLATLLQDPASRLLTLIGPGGIGKTRLAVEVARQLDFVDGIYFVPLQSLNSGDNLLSAIADALQIRLNDTVDPLHLYQYFRERQMLFILDNFEHLLKQIEVVTDILNAT